MAQFDKFLRGFVPLFLFLYCYVAGFQGFQHTEYARSIPKYWRSHQATWWKPEKLWVQAFEVLKESGIFCSIAFASP